MAGEPRLSGFGRLATPKPLKRGSPTKREGLIGRPREGSSRKREKRRGIAMGLPPPNARRGQQASRRYSCRPPLEVTDAPVSSACTVRIQCDSLDGRRDRFSSPPSRDDDLSPFCSLDLGSTCRSCSATGVRPHALPLK